jgi:hypothetical protein
MENNKDAIIKHLDITFVSEFPSLAKFYGQTISRLIDEFDYPKMNIFYQTLRAEYVDGELFSDIIRSNSDNLYTASFDISKKSDLSTTDIIIPLYSEDKNSFLSSNPEFSSKTKSLADIISLSKSSIKSPHSLRERNFVKKLFRAKPFSFEKGYSFAIEDSSLYSLFLIDSLENIHNTVNKIYNSGSNNCSLYCF